MRELVKLFAVDLNASQVASVAGLNRNTVNRYLKAIRVRVAEQCQKEPETYFDAKRIKGRRGAEHLEKPSSSVSSEETVRCSRRLSPTVKMPPFK